MFCPTCGAHQTGERRFCTSCGQNLLLVSQALGGRRPAQQLAPPQRPPHLEIDRQRDLAKGVKLTIIGGAFLAIQFFSFIFSLPFRSNGSPFGFLSFVALILMAVGVSKLVNARPVVTQSRSPYEGYEQGGIGQGAPQLTTPPLQPMNPQPVFSENHRSHPDAPATGELIDVRSPGPSITEEDTQHLPGFGPPPQKQA